MSLIVIDPGHGGRDPGAVACGLKEKELNLAICRELMGLLKKGGAAAVLTRDQDIFLGLEQRCEMANNWKGDWFLSVHCNASQNQSAEGIEVYYAGGSEAGKEFASALHGQISKLGRLDRGVKPTDYYVLKHTQMPACLVECGFITNSEEAAWLKNHVLEIAQAMARKIIEIVS